MIQLKDEEVWANCAWFAETRKILMDGTKWPEGFRGDLIQFLVDIEEHMIQCRQAVK